MKLLITLSVLLCLSLEIDAADSFAGKWDLTIVQRGFAMEGLLELRETENGLVAFAEGGPVRLSITGQDIEMGIDDRTAAGMPFERTLRGKLADGSMSGKFGPRTESGAEIKSLCKRLPLACPAPTGTWTATPHANTQQPAAAKPVDLSGSWVIEVGGIRRWTADLTQSAKDWKADFNVVMDLPAQRCQPSGLVLSWGFRGNEPEIFQSSSKITIALGSTLRRIYLDDRQPPEYTDWYPMGFSSGQWQGSTLVVKTTHLQPTVREWMGDPISENATVVENYSIDKKGRLVGVLTIHDPENYRQPMVKRARWRKETGSKIRFPSLCDPDSFYRELYDDDLLEDYWQRSHRRY